MKKHIISTCILFFLLAGNAFAQQSVPQDTTILSDIIIVRLVENFKGNGLESQIIIYYGNDRFETIELKNYRPSNYPVTNLEKIHTVVTRLYQKKYTLVNNYISGGAQNFIFKKAD